MEDCSSTQSLSNLQHHRHCTTFPLTLPSFQSSKVGYPSSQPSQDSLEQYGSKGEEPTASILTPNPSSGSKRGSSGAERAFLSTSGSSLDGDAILGVHFDGDSKLGFDDSWYIKKEAWDDGESESAADDFHGKGDCYGNANDVFYSMNCAAEEGDGRRIKANYNSYAHAGLQVKSESVYNREVNMSPFAKQAVSCNRGSFNGRSADYCRADSEVSDNYLGGEEDYGSSCGSGEDQLQSAEAEGRWLSVSPTRQPERRWREAAEAHTLTSGCAPQRSPAGISNQTYTQKLDSFSDAFFSQRKRRFPMTPSGNSSTQIWEFGGGRGETSRQSCAFDSENYLPPPASSSSPAYPSVPSFPSPPTSSHLTFSVLSPPPTPLPPPSYSPSKMDSPGAQVAIAHSQAGESPGGFQIFTPHFQPLPSVTSPGMIWKFPLLPHCIPHVPGDPGNNECNLRPSHGDEYADGGGTVLWAFLGVEL